MRRVVLALALTTGLAAASPAQASTVSYSPPVGFVGDTCPMSPCRLATVTVEGDATTNVIEVVESGGTETVRDSAAVLEAGSGCTKQGDGSVSCPAGRTTIRGAAGDDRLTWSGTTARVFGGYGNDALTGGGELRGGPGADILAGADSDDDLFGGPGADRVTGGAGADILGDSVDPRRDEPAPEEAEPQADLLDGGPGLDWLVFRERRQPLTIDLVSSPQRAGAKGEGNRVGNIELATGGKGSDTLRYKAVRGEFRDVDAAPSYLTLIEAGSGDDRITLAGPLVDMVVWGGRGDDVIRGSSGNDELEGAEGNDFIDGGAGNDVVGDHNGRDVLRGGAGNDKIEAADTFGTARDLIDCGPGRDLAELNRRGDRARGCERIRFPLSSG